jgi:hypothetical protein
MNIYCTAAYLAGWYEKGDLYEPHMSCMAFVKSIKGVHFASPRYLGGRMMRPGNPENALIVFAEWARQLLRNLPGPLILVPVPGSKLTIGTLPHDVGSKAHILAEKAAEIIGPKALVADILRFLEPHQSVSQGNSNARDRQWLKNQLCMNNNPPYWFSVLPPGQVILIDDVLTSGSHLMACHDFLLSKFRGRSDLKPFALCAARTVKKYVDRPYPYPDVVTIT